MHLDLRLFHRYQFVRRGGGSKSWERAMEPVLELVMAMLPDLFLKELKIEPEKATGQQRLNECMLLAGSN